MTRTLINKTSIMDYEYQIKLFILYLVMISGGMIQYFQVFADEMNLLATFVIAGISGLIVAEYYWYIKSIILPVSQRRSQIRKFGVWLIIVFLLSMIIENIGVVSGAIFGTYTYGPVLYPFIGHVPAAIGFAWINTIATSTNTNPVLTAAIFLTSLLLLQTLTSLPFSIHPSTAP